MSERTKTEIISVETDESGTTSVKANNPELGRPESFLDCNIFAAESPEFTARLRELAKEQGISLEEMRVKWYSMVP